ncbi:MAG: phage holin family protein [Marmoricola sp.]|nr:phage holin family protein [Marmoricola sp.]
MTENPYPTGQPGALSGTETAPSSTRSLGEIVGDITQDMSTLIRQEMDLATSEMKREVAKLGKGVGMFGGAGATGYLTLIFLSLALTYLLDNWMPVELAALVVALLWGAVTAALALKGRQEIKNANPDLPVTQQTLKEDAQWARTQKN